MDVVAKLLFVILVLMLVAVALGLLGVVGHALHWVFDAWSGDTNDRPEP
jgi:hypothetical protein